MVRNSLVLWFFCQPSRPLRKRWDFFTLEVRVCCVFWVSGQKSHHQNNEDVHGQVCHCEFHFTFTEKKSCCLMGKWRGFHCFWDFTGVSCSSRCGSHNHSIQSTLSTFQVISRRFKSQERVLWAQCDVAQNIWQLQQNSCSQPEQNSLVCFSPQQTHTLEAVCFSIQLKYTMTCQCVLNDFESSFKSHLNLPDFLFLIHFHLELFTGRVWSPGSSGCIWLRGWH